MAILNTDGTQYAFSKIKNELNQLKSDFVAKTSMLSYEEIIASTPPINLDVAIPKASALKELGSVVGAIYEFQSTGITSIPPSTDCVIYKGLLPKGVYILTAKLFVNSTNCLIMCQNLRTQYMPSVYYTLSGLIESDGLNEIGIIVYQTSDNTITKDYNYDYVRLVRLK